MKIDKAIKNLRAAKKDAGMVPDEEWAPTLNLAIEALKEVKKHRSWPLHLDIGLLPGETEE